MIRTEHTANRTLPRPKLGLSVPAVLLLAAVAAVRVPLHDLGLVQEGSAFAWLLVFVPLAIWVIVVLRQRVPNPVLTLTAVGLVSAVMLAVTHQVFWGAAFGDPPSLGGNLGGALAAGQENLVLRVSAFLSSIFTGVAVGAAAGAAAWVVARTRRA